MVISELHTWPVCTPVNASPASFRTQTHDSEPKWCATPFLCGSLIRYSLPVYPGAFLDDLIRSRQHIGRNCQTDLLRGFQVDFKPWRPGGSVTGLTSLWGNLSGKRLELLKETVPQLSRVAVIWHSSGGAEYSVERK